MGLVVLCDGCGKQCEEGEAKQHGFYDKAFYCHSCNPIYEELERQRDQLRIEASMLFEARWKDLKLTTKQHQKLRKLPDDAGREG